MTLHQLRPQNFPIAAIVAAAVLGSAVSVPAFADDRPPAAFTPADISIGEPISLPVAPPTKPAAAADDPASPPRPATSAVPGSGWLGITVAESAVPGRWRIDDVVAGGPAARAGVAVGDELRAVNGITLKSLEEASQAVTSIASGQEVRIAVARADQAHDLTLVAEPRPVAVAGREWQGAAAGGPAPAATVPLPQTPSAAPPISAPRAAADPLPPPGAAAFAAAPQAYGAAGPATPPAPTPGPAVFAPVVPAPVAEAGGRTDPVATARGRTALGVRTLPIDPGIQARFKLPDTSGAYVIGVVQDLPASKAGLPPGSVIVALDNRPVRSPVELTQLVTSGPVDRPVTVQFVLPGGEAKRAEVVLQPLEVPLERALLGATPPGVTSPPTLRTAEKPSGADATAPLVEEIGFLRSRLERLERRLQALVPSR